MSGFVPFNGEDFDKVFITQYDLIDRYAMGTLWGWGYNGFGMLGDGTTTNKSSPVQVSTKGISWKQVSSAAYHSASIRSDSTLWTCGYNRYGQLGDGTTVNKSTPTQISGTDWKYVSTPVNGSSTYAIKTNGTLWSWGLNTFGELGSGTTINRSSPVQIGTSSDNSWKQISCGGEHNLGIKTDGSIWAWGYNFYGQLGDGTTFNRSSPVQVGTSNWVGVFGGSGHSIALRSDGALFACGYNRFGQLGDGTTVNKSLFTQIGSNTNWKQIAAGGQGTSSIKYDGTLWTWGYNTAGQLGDGTTTNKSSPVQVGNNNNWKQVSVGYNNSSAIKTDGTLWTWGYNFYGAIGDGTTTDKSSPVQVYVGGNNWKQVSAGFDIIRATQYSNIEQVL